MPRKRKEKWFHPKTHMGWAKDLPAAERRDKALKAHGGDALAAARALLALANVTKDKETRRLARADADYFFRMHRRQKEE